MSEQIIAEQSVDENGHIIYRARGMSAPNLPLLAEASPRPAFRLSIEPAEIVLNGPDAGQSLLVDAVARTDEHCRELELTEDLVVADELWTNNEAALRLQFEQFVRLLAQ